ncbi:hypothetical protein LTR70_009588 [Exophiala xenobiotica]|nr:hypothetical protein LTR70_009588 [Exophiala xenobiotica]
MAGLVNEDRGLRMRFSQFLRVRKDESIEETSTNDFLANSYRKQKQKLKPARWTTQRRSKGRALVNATDNPFDSFSTMARMIDVHQSAHS